MESKSAWRNIRDSTLSCREDRRLELFDGLDESGLCAGWVRCSWERLMKEAWAWYESHQQALVVLKPKRRDKEGTGSEFLAINAGPRFLSSIPRTL
jgi:hypothetical protein